MTEATNFHAPTALADLETAAPQETDAMFDAIPAAPAADTRHTYERGHLCPGEIEAGAVLIALEAAGVAVTPSGFSSPTGFTWAQMKIMNALMASPAEARAVCDAAALRTAGAPPVPMAAVGRLLPQVFALEEEADRLNVTPDDGYFDAWKAVGEARLRIEERLFALKPSDLADAMVTLIMVSRHISIFSDPGLQFPERAKILDEAFARLGAVIDILGMHVGIDPEAFGRGFYMDGSFAGSEVEPEA